MPFIVVPMVLVALTLALLSPHLDVWASARKWVAPGLVAVLEVALLLFANLTSGFAPGQPMQNGVWYELNAGTGTAAWYSLGEKPEDPWTAQFFPGATEPVQLADVYPALSELSPLGGFRGIAPVAPVPAPELAVVSDETAGEVRTVRLHLSSRHQARGLRVEVTGSPVLGAAVNGIRGSNAAG